MNRTDIEFTTFNVGRKYRSGFITHIPTGLIVEWKTSKEKPFEYGAREEAFKELERLVKLKTNKL